ncbi:uncharacterized protein LOC142495188 isoform X4 [Ascaphus truei]|uniref:uncharacterized protein LOC142495188 isoform X4 n=1 Tax=Ascaphus truei TaxID=8439 RepID=UPI003F5A3D6B
MGSGASMGSGANSTVRLVSTNTDLRGVDSIGREVRGNALSLVSSRQAWKSPGASTHLVKSLEKTQDDHYVGVKDVEKNLKEAEEKAKEQENQLAKCEGTILDPTEDAACVEENLNVVEITADDEIPSEETIEATKQLAKCEGTILDPTEDAACVEENLNVVKITADDEIPSEETIEATNQSVCWDGRSWSQAPDSAMLAVNPFKLAKCEETILDPTEDAACVEENLNVVEITADDEIPSEETIEATKQLIQTLEAELERTQQELSFMLAKCEGTILDPTEDAACVEENLNVVEITADDEIPSEETIEAKKQLIQTLEAELERTQQELSFMLAKCEETILDPTEDAACVEENLNVVEITADDKIPCEETIEAKNQLIQTLEAELERTQQELSFMKLKHKRRIRKAQKQLLDSKKAASLSILELQSQIKSISEGSHPSADVVSLYGHYGLSGEVSRAHSGHSLIAEMSSQVSHQQDTIKQLEQILAQRERKIIELEGQLQALGITADKNYQPDTEETGNGQYEEVNVMESDIDFGRLLSPFPSAALLTSAKDGIAFRHLDNVSVYHGQGYQEKSSPVASCRRNGSLTPPSGVSQC